MTDEQLYDKIEAYLLGDLPKEEAEAFARQIEADPTLAEQVGLHRLEHEAMELLVEKELRQNLKGWMEEARAADNVRTLRPVYRRTWFQLAAAAAVLLLIGIFVLRPDGGPAEPGPVAQEEYPRERVLLPYEEENNTGAGLAGAAEGADSIVVLLLRNDRYNNHYRFRDTLEIFYTEPRPDIAGWRLAYDAATDSYRLLTPAAGYPLNKGFNSIYELKEK